MDDIDDSVLKELQLSIQAIESSLKDDDYGEHAAPSKQRHFGDDYHYDDDDAEDEDEDDAEGDYDHDDDFDDDYDIDPEDEGEDPASSEAELAAMMDGLVAELQAEIQEQILQDHLGGGGGDEQDHHPITTTEEEEEEDDDDDKFKSSPAYDGGGDDGDDIPSLAYEHLETPRRKDEVTTYVDDKDCYARGAPNVPHLDIPSTTPTNISQGGDNDGDHNRHHAEQDVPVSDYTASPAAPPLVYEQVQSPRKDEPDYVPVADYTKPKLTTQSSNNRNKESSSSSQRSVLLQRFIRYLSSDASPNTKNKATNTNPVPPNMIYHQEVQDEEEAACPSTDDGVEDVRFEKINGVSVQDPDYAPVQDYTMGGASSPKKQRRGKREKAGGATPLTSTSTSSTKSSREEAMTQERHELLSAGVLVEEHPTTSTSTSSTTQHEGKSNSHHQYHGQHPLSNNKPRKRRTNKHLKRGRVEKMLVESLMNDHNGNNNQTTGGSRTKDEAIRLLAESKLWNIICQQAFVASSK